MNAPTGTFGAAVTVLVRYLVAYFVIVTILIFGLVAFPAEVVAGAEVVVVVAGVVAAGVAPLDSARACAALDAVVVAPLFASFVFDGLLPAVEDAGVVVVATSAGSNAPAAVVEAGAAAAGDAGGVLPPLPPQPATATATTRAAIALGARELGKRYVLRMSTTIASEERRVIDSVPHELFIGGSWQEGEHGTFEVEDPSTGDVLAQVADSSPADALRALDAAVEAAPAWAAYPPRERGEILRRAFETIISRTDELALLMTLEMGKPLAEARSEIVYAAEFLRWFSEEAVRIDGRFSTAPNGQGRLLTMQQPVGPCLLVTPWNFPLAMGTRKVGPAIAAGCTMVVKPAQLTPLSMLAFAKILEDCGLPAGVLNLVTSSKAGPTTAPLIADKRLRKLSFTGSTEVGRTLMREASETLLRLSMELGGNAPFLVFEDADVDAAVQGAVLAKMRNIGEACTAANRFHVHESVADEFSKKLAARLGSMKLGRGVEDKVEVGPLIDGKQRDKVAALVDDAVGRGAKVLTGGKAVDGPGYFYEATVLGDVPDGSDLLTEEIFGPVAPVRTFSDEDGALADANASDYGLAAYVFTRDLKRALRVSERLETGMIGLNQGIVSNPAAPFGGIKQSGFGREGGSEGITEYLATKYLAINMD
jgi:succinate-semialdehyde dehydrogenase / glutarate-semialdehyde dehydrogenase